MKQIKEERAIVLDFLQNGYPFEKGGAKTPIVQALGAQHFSLLELIPKKDIFLQPYAEVYIGEGKREEIHHIKGKIKVNSLTSTAKAELKYVIQDLVKKNEPKFIDFFNTAAPLSTRMHQIELLPGVGKKHMWQIIEERRNEPFKSFADLKARVKLLPNPEQAIIKRIIKELEGEEKHHLFVD